MSLNLSRRQLLGSALAATAFAKAARAEVNFVFGTYGMKALSAAEAIKTSASIGYDGVQLCLMPGFSTDPSALTAGDRKQIRTMLKDANLALPAVLESLPLSANKRTANLERLKKIAEFAHDLDPKNPPALDTILGLKTAEWDQARPRMADELREWARIAEDAKMTVGVKPHAAHALNNAERTIALVKDVGSPRIRVIYDYSHFYVEGFQLEQSFRELQPYINFVSVKDSSGTPEKHDYLLPGDGKTNYDEYFKMLNKLGYRGGVGVEVSAMIHRKPGYEAIPTAKLCYERLAPIFEKAGLKRTHTRVV
jgi:inosose dehydratase